MASVRKPRGRLDLESPYQRDHERSNMARLRHPQSLRDLMRELRDAVEAESVERLHVQGVEPESALGAPKMSPRMLSRLGAATAVNEDETAWVWPHRSALYRMGLARSGVTRSAGEFVALLPTHRYNVREAWAVQAGSLIRPAALDVAEAWAEEALRRWWGHYIEQPRGRMLA